MGNTLRYGGFFLMYFGVQGADIDDFAQRLHLITEQVAQEDQKFDKEFEKLLQQTGTSQPLLTMDNNTYQINAPYQDKDVGCGFLTFRNAYTILQSLANRTFLDFIKSYYLKEIPEQFCDLKYEGGITFEAMRAAKLEKDFQPLNNRIIYFYSTDPRHILDPYGDQLNPAVKQYKTIMQDLKNIIKKYENNPAEEVALRAALLHASIKNNYNGYTLLKKEINNLNNNKNYFFGIITTSSITEGLAHAVLLIVHKHNNILRYYFMDPANYSFTHSKSVGKRYRTSLHGLKLFIEHPEQLDNAMVRYLRYMYKNNDTGFKNVIQGYGLADNDIYKNFYS